MKHFRNLVYSRCSPLGRNDQALSTGVIHCPLVQSREMQTSDLCSHHICAQLAPRADASLAPTQPPAHHAVSLSASCLPHCTHSPPFWLPVPTSQLGQQVQTQLSGSGPRHSRWHRPQAPRPHSWGTKPSASHPSPRVVDQQNQHIQTGTRHRGPTASGDGLSAGRGRSSAPLNKRARLSLSGCQPLTST